MAGKAKFDQEAAFKSIIGAGATEDEKKADKPAGKGRPPVERETKSVLALLFIRAVTELYRKLPM